VRNAAAFAAYIPYSFLFGEILLEHPSL